MSKGIRHTATIENPDSDVSLVEFAVLGLLHERPMHGYEVARHFAPELDLGLVLPLELSTVYGVLKDLQSRDLIAGEQQTVGRRPTRTVFSLLPEAEKGLRRWLEEPVSRTREVRSALLVKLYFCRRLGGSLSVRLLTAQVTASAAYLDELLQRQRDVEPGSFEELVCASKSGAARATLTWLEGEINRTAVVAGR